MAYRVLRVPVRDAAVTRRLVETVAQVYGRDPRMRAWLIHEVLEPAGVHQRDAVGIVRAIHEGVRDRIRFALEAGEQVLTPVRCIVWGFGDCDDRTGLVCALLEAARVKWRTRLLARRGVPFHIWPQARVDGRWLDLETSDDRTTLGEHPIAFMRRAEGVGF